MTELIYITKSSLETEKAGEEISRHLQDTAVLALYGGLGAGKTTLTRGIAKGFGIFQGVKSPTYAIINEYCGDRKIYHFDMYRIGSPEELYEIGWEDYTASGALCIVEWSENVTDALPEKCATVTINILGENEREVMLRIC